MGELRAGASSKRGTLLNIIGPQVRRLRRNSRLTQADLVARCQIAGYDLSRESLAKLEGRTRSVTDAEILLLSEILQVPINSLFPEPDQTEFILRPFRSSS